MEILLQKRCEGHRNPGCHKSRMLMLGSPQARSLQAHVATVAPAKHPVGEERLAEESLEWTVRWPWGVQPAPAHAWVCTVLPSFPHLPTSTQQVTTTGCLPILISLGQRQPCALPHINSLITMLVSTEGCCES